MSTVVSRQMARIRRGVLETAGWKRGTSLEDSVALILYQAGFAAGTVAQQHPVDRYRLDFAFVDLMIALEVDGWQHRNPENAARDADRDATLRAKGWIVLRVDDRSGLEGVNEQMVRVCRLIHRLRGTKGTGPGASRQVAAAMEMA
jgi:very-short-patch-repair endonuclease